LLHHVAPPVYHEVEGSQEADLKGEEAGPKPHVLGSSFMVGAKANVNVGNSSGTNCDSEKPMEEVPQAPYLSTSGEKETG
jgi:hypothetical protein